MKPQINKTTKLIKSVIDSSPIKNKEFVKSINVYEDRFGDGQHSVAVVFHHGILDKSERQNFLDDCWRAVYAYTEIPVYLIDSTDYGRPMNESEDKRVSLLEKFIENMDLSGLCGFWVDEEEDTNGYLWVYIILDLDMIEHTKPGFVENRYRVRLREEIKKFLNIDVRIGTTSRKCSEVEG